MSRLAFIRMSDDGPVAVFDDGHRERIPCKSAEPDGVASAILHGVLIAVAMLAWMALTGGGAILLFVLWPVGLLMLGAGVATGYAAVAWL